MVILKQWTNITLKKNYCKHNLDVSSICILKYYAIKEQMLVSILLDASGYKGKQFRYTIFLFNSEDI